MNAAKSWLLIYDNVESYRALRKFWPHNPRGAALITSQREDVNRLTAQSLKIDPLDFAQGTELFLRQAARDEKERKTALAIVEELGGLPLAIVQYAGFAGQSPAPLGELLDAFKKRNDAMMHWTAQSSEISLLYYEKTLGTVWDQALAELTPEAQDMLQVMSYLYPEDIPRSMLSLDGGDMSGSSQDTSSKLVYS